MMLGVVRMGWMLCLLALVSIPDPASAQDITGALQGEVVSPDGKPEPEVRVSVSGPFLQGSRETRTDRDGFFQFLALPPGTYGLRVTRIGMRPLEVREIAVELGRTAAVGPLTIEPQPIEMSPVEVHAKPLALDPVHTTVGGTLEAADYAALPVERDYKSLIAILPLATDSHRGDPVNVGGSTGLENQYYIDGVNVTDTRVADRATSLPYDFVRAVDVKMGGYEAQYGRALGAVVNALTYSGTNDLEASVFGFGEPGRFAAKPRTAPVIGEAGAVAYDYGARVSGPVRRDRLWYSAAVNPRVDRVDKLIAGLGSYADKASSVRFASKLTWRANPVTNVELSVFGDPTVRDRVNPLPVGITSVANPDPLLLRVESGGVTTSLRASTAPMPSLMLQASVAQQRTRYSEEGGTSRGRSEESYLDYFTGSLGGGLGYRIRDHHDRTNLTLRGTLTLPGHTLITGMDYEDASVTSGARLTSLQRLDSVTYMTQLETYSGTFHNRSPALYLQDAWRLTDRLTLNAGMRWSGQYLIGASGRTAQRITNEWQPRAGFVWEIGRMRSQRLLGSYGRFYQTLPANIPVMWFVDYTALYSVYSTDPRQPGAVPDQVFDGSSFEKDYAHQIPRLQAENFDEFTLGYERLIGSAARLTVRGIRRDLRSSFQWGEDLSRNNIWVLGTPGKGDFSFLPPPKREYTALELSAEGTWRRLRYRTSYVLSRTWGNYPGLFDSDQGAANPGRVSTFEAPHQSVNSTGYLPNDHTHVVKLSAACGTGFGLGTGALLTFESGAPINDFAAAPLYGPTMPAFLVQRGTAGRTPALWNLDLRVTYDLSRSAQPRVRMYADVLHVGNPRRATRVDELHFATTDENGNPSTPNPFYGTPVAYQPPMAGRVGLQIRF